MLLSLCVRLSQAQLPFINLTYPSYLPTTPSNPQSPLSTTTALFAPQAAFKGTTSCTLTPRTATKRTTRSSPIAPTKTLLGSWSRSSTRPNAPGTKTSASPGKSRPFAETASSSRLGGWGGEGVPEGNNVVIKKRGGRVV